MHHRRAIVQKVWCFRIFSFERIVVLPASEYPVFVTIATLEMEGLWKTRLVGDDHSKEKQALTA